MTHNQRLDWLKSHGWIPDGKAIDLPNFGRCIWIDGSKGKMPHSLWLALDDGRAILHGGGADMTWEELQEWINPAPVVTKPTKTQKGMFDE